MKIISVDLIKCKRQSHSAQSPVLCRINTHEGIYGYCEAGVSIMDFSIGPYEIMKEYLARVEVFRETVGPDVNIIIHEHHTSRDPRDVRP